MTLLSWLKVKFKCVSSHKSNSNDVITNVNAHKKTEIVIVRNL